MNGQGSLTKPSAMVTYGDFQAIKKINLPIYENKVTALIGPSGCGKSTFLRSFNQMNLVVNKMVEQGMLKRNDGEVASGQAADVAAS